MHLFGVLILRDIDVLGKVNKQTTKFDKGYDKLPQVTLQIKYFAQTFYTASYWQLEQFAG